MLFIAAVITLAILCGVSGESAVEYYENLIHQRTTAAQDYEIPTSNSEFREGANSDDITDIGSYDFIIVGAGTAGSVLATRLSEIDEWNVLLLEAGGEEDDFSSIPNMFMFLQFSEMNWGYATTPQTTCCQGMRGKRCLVPRGKSIGGSSAINAVYYSRGHPKDYDRWADMGNPGWSFEEVLPYFIKSENSQIMGDPGYHGKGGFWNVEYSRPVTELYSEFVKGHEELNIPLVDYNGKDVFGISKAQLNIRHGKRQSTGTAFLDNARNRNNLKIFTKALVTKINIDEKTKTAQGVTFVHNNTKFSASATKEVLLSGGAINSPQLLMLSGIGPRKHLEELDINVIEDLPVGENLLEHPVFPTLVFRTNYTHPDPDIKDQIKEYFDGFGPLTSPANLEAVAFIPTNNNPMDVPTIEYVFLPPGASPLPIVSRVYNYDETITNQYIKNINSKTDIIFFMILLHQKSRGRITLKSKDPIDFPNIDLNLFSESEDVDTFIEGIEFIIKLSETDAFKKLNATLLDIPICEGFNKYSKPFWECVIRHIAATLFHPSSTTIMGPDKATSVVDANLKVHGIEKLRVVDVGVFPTTISGHPAAPVVMAAEKISDVIKRDYHVEECGSPFSHSHHYTPKESCYRN